MIIVIIVLTTLAAGGISEVEVTSNSFTWTWKIEFSDEMLHLLADAEKG